jgi:peptidoglycan/xylan/chitin deacetylase (PgdA/CDA1 family)
MGIPVRRPCGRGRSWLSRIVVLLVFWVTLGCVLLLASAAPANAAACERGRVALTFDDGPSRANAERLLEVLADRRARATFFLVGRSVAARPAVTRQIADAGHRIYNHTYDHVNLTTASDRRIRRQIRRTERAFTSADVASSGPLVRPPYGAIDARVRRVLRDIGFRTVLWTVDTRDWQSSTTADQIVRRVVTGLEPGANILMHDQEDTQATVGALPRVIRAVRTRGYCLGVLNRYGRVVAR